MRREAHTVKLVLPVVYDEKLQELSLLTYQNKTTEGCSCLQLTQLKKKVDSSIISEKQPQPSIHLSLYCSGMEGVMRTKEYNKF